MVRNYIRKTDRGLAYSREQLQEAVGKVRSGEMNSYMAAIHYKIPRTTLYDHVIGRAGKSNTLGKPPALPEVLEKIIAENLNALKDNGFNLSRKEVLDLVGLYLNSNNVKNPFKAGKPGECWLQAFTKRHGFTPRLLYKEFGGKDKGVILVKEFYSLLETRINELHLADKPGQIWHIEEHSFYKGKRVANYDKQKDVAFVTACSADGRKAPLLTVFIGKDNHDWMLGKHVNVSHARGLCTDVFKNYFETVFLNYIDDAGPNLVIFEAQSSLVDLDLIAEATKASVTMVKIPNYLASLDIVVNNTFKLKSNDKKLTSSKDFAKAVADVFDGVQATEIKEDFKNAGVHPFEEVCDSKLNAFRLKVYEEYKVFKESQKRLDSPSIDPEEVLIKEDSEFQMNFQMELDDSSMSLTEEAESPGTISGQFLRSALIAVKKGLTVMEVPASVPINEARVARRNQRNSTVSQRLVAWVTDMNNAGFAITKDNLTEAAHNLEILPFHTTDWCEDFLRQHPELKGKLSQKVSDKVTVESLRVWLVCVKKYLKKMDVEDILNCPRRIFNYGEVASYHKPKANLNEDKANEDLTVLVTASADGNLQKPSVIFPFKLPEDLASSWTKADILNDYMIDIFYPWLIEHDIHFPVILFMDRTTHINISLSEYFNDQQIIPIALPDGIQPINAVLRPLERHWEHNKGAIQKLNNEKLAKEIESYLNRDFREEITNTLKNYGMYPFNTHIKCNINEIGRNVKTKEDMDASKAVSEKGSDILKEVEERIPKEVLEEFIKSGDSWVGDTRQNSLFIFWKSLRDAQKEDTRMETDNSIRLGMEGERFEVFIENATTLEDF